MLREVFGFDELTIEDCFTRDHLPKVDIYDDYLFVVFFSFHPSEERQRVETVELDMYIRGNYVVCVHPRPLRELERVMRRLLSRDEFAHTVLEATVDECLPIMNRLPAIVDGKEDELLAAEEHAAPDRHSDHLPAAHLLNQHLRDELLLHTGIQLTLRLLRHPGAEHFPGRGNDSSPLAQEDDLRY